uniref:Mlx n=1 Tax=Phallusia mammillata TaxID=59560 RepID=A0A6F9DL03_9ASCI|nr:Mlx [Phallusia mammillata]
MYKVNMMERILRNETEAHRKGEVIHSGHFMISSVADDQEDLTETIDHDRDSPIHHEQSIMIKHGYDFSNVAMETKNTYQFGPSHSNHITIDGSLSRLFQCMSLAYRGGKVVSPKWKNFKGMKLTVKDKIRLNNAIWRTWHIQYVMMKKKQHAFIQFVTPLEVEGDYDSHTKPEAVVMEGKYWKRRIETVVAEYKKWRAYFMERCINSHHDMTTESFELEALRHGDDQQFYEFTDTLFSSLSQQPFQFPNPREIALHATNSDMIQPGLLQLQPSVDDFDFDPLQDFFASAKKSVAPVFGMSHPSTHNEFSSVSDPFMSAEISTVLEQTHAPSSSLNTISSNTAQQQAGYSGIQHHHHHQQQQLELPTPIEPPKLVTQHNMPQANVANLARHSSINYLSQGGNVSQHSSNKTSSTEHLKQHHISPTHFQANEGAKPVESMNRSSFMTSYNTPGSAPFAYPHSKLGPNQPLDKIIYTQPQMGMSVEYLQQNVSTQQVSQANAGSGHLNATQIDQAVARHSKQNKDGDISVKPSDSPNVFLLKQLLTNKSNTNKVVPSNRQAIAKVAEIRPIDEPSIIPKNTNTPSSRHVDQHPSSSSSISPTKSFNNDQSSTSDIFMEHGEEFPVSFADSDGAVMLQRSGSFSAEQKRRFNIKLGFNRLQKFLPNINVQSNSKISKASLMNKATQYIKSLQNERQKVSDEIQALKQELDDLKSEINSCQQQLPATGAPVSRPPIEESKTKYKQWIRQRTKQDWKFFVFGIIIEPWFESYQCMVSVSGSSDLCRSVFDWVDQKCALPVLRPSVVQSLQVLSTSTSILSHPSQLQKQIEDSVQGNSRNDN